MARLHFEKGNFIVQSDSTDNLLDWEHSLFFSSVMGFQRDTDLHRYKIRQNSKILDVLREVIDYLENEAITFETDEQVGNLVARLRWENKEYENALRAADELARATTATPYLPRFVRKLKPYQERSVRSFLAAKHAANFSVPGSGKTTIIYAAFETLQESGEIDKLLVIGPRSSFMPWEEEYKACFGETPKSARLTGSRTARQSIYLQSSDFEMFICTYQTAANDIEDLIELCRRYKMFLVVDESHNIKNPNGVWSDALLQLAPYAMRRAILSGTPLPQSPGDLWTQITVLWPGKQVLGERDAYLSRCEEEDQQENLRDAIRPFMVRIGKSELGLPPPQFRKISCILSPYQSNIYHALSVRFLRELNLPPQELTVLRMWRKARMVRLIQAASNPTLLVQYSEEFDVPPLSGEGLSILQLLERYPQYETPAKFAVATKLARALVEDGEKVLIWTTFVHNIRMLQKLLQDTNPYIIYGAVPRDASEDDEYNREQQIRDFKESSSAAILIANPAACAESISLHHVCRHAIYMDRTFNCGQYMQSLDRIHRIGLNRDEIVTYHIIVAENTIDETVDRRLDEKQRRMSRLLGDEITVGTLDTEPHQMSQTASEEDEDFAEMVSDLKRHIEAFPSEDTTN